MQRKPWTSVKERLDTKYGVMLLQPALYQLSPRTLVKFPLIRPDTRKMPVSSATTIRGSQSQRPSSDMATAPLIVYKKTCPAYIEDISEIHRTEPYVYSQMVAGADARILR